MLDTSDVAIAPAFDGGYCLVAFNSKSYSKNIFCNIPWSTESVLKKTLEACRAENVTYALLEYRQDIDTVNDVLAYCHNVFLSSPATNAWLMKAGYLMKLPF